MVKFVYHKLMSNQTKNLCIKCIKPVILITSLMTFVYLVINTVNSNAFVPKIQSDNKVDNIINQSLKVNLLDDIVRNFEFDKSNDNFIKTIIKDLDLLPGLYVEDVVGDALCKANKSKYQNIITSLPGDKLIDFIWEYISIWSLSSELKKLKQTFNVYLTDKTIHGLSNLFEIEGLQFSSLYEVPRKCLNIQLTKVLQPTQTLNLKNYAADVPFVLEKNSKRVFDIVASDLRPLRHELRIRKEVHKTVEHFMRNVIDSMRVKMVKGDNYKFVCSYLEANQLNYLPYLKSSIEFHNREGTSNIFIFMVPPTELQLYSQILETSKRDTIKVLSHNESESFNVALLMQCDRTIILNDFTLATALLNAGLATIPKDDPLFILFKSKIFNWYALDSGDDDSKV